MANDEFSWVWDGIVTGDAELAPYSAYDYTRIYKLLFTRTNQEGVIGGYLNGLLASNPSGQTIRVASGGGVVNGYFYRNTANVDNTIVVPQIATRYDRVVLECDTGAQTVRIAILTGTEGAGAVELRVERTNIWQIPLAMVQITTGGVITVTDERQYCRMRMEDATEEIQTGWNFIEEIECIGVENSIVFENISNQFMQLMVLGHVRHSDITGQEGDSEFARLDMVINYDNGLKYHRVSEYTLDTTVAAAVAGIEGSGDDNKAILRLIASEDAPTGSFSPVFVHIPNNTQQSTYKIWHALTGVFGAATANPSALYSTIGEFSETPRITSLKFFNADDPSGTFVAGSTLSLYGLKDS